MGIDQVRLEIGKCGLRDTKIKSSINEDIDRYRVKQKSKIKKEKNKNSSNSQAYSAFGRRQQKFQPSTQEFHLQMTTIIPVLDTRIPSSNDKAEFMNIHFSFWRQKMRRRIFLTKNYRRQEFKFRENAIPQNKHFQFAQFYLLNLRKTEGNWYPTIGFRAPKIYSIGYFLLYKPHFGLEQIYNIWLYAFANMHLLDIESRKSKSQDRSTIKQREHNPLLKGPCPQARNYHIIT